MKESLRQQDYHKVFQKRGDCIRLLAQTSGVVIFFAWFFYRSIWAVPLLFPLGILYFRRCVNRQCRKNRQELTMQFKECILSVANSLRSGYALENAFLESREDIRMLYGEHSAMYRELELIRRGMILNITLEELISDPNVRNVIVSDYIETEPYGYVDQDKFLNGAATIETLLSPEDLLAFLHRIEEKADRKREIHWGPRTLDLDILLYDDVCIHTKDLIVPHIDMCNRMFVLEPLMQIAPGLVHPVLLRQYIICYTMYFSWHCACFLAHTPVICFCWGSPVF